MPAGALAFFTLSGGADPYKSMHCLAQQQQGTSKETPACATWTVEIRPLFSQTCTARIQKFPDGSGSPQMFPDVSRCFQMCPEVSRGV
eukprot:jgi/Chrzof1/7976/UNPLg00900.t1